MEEICRNWVITPRRACRMHMGANKNMGVVPILELGSFLMRAQAKLVITYWRIRGHPSRSGSLQRKLDHVRQGVTQCAF